MGTFISNNIFTNYLKTVLKPLFVLLYFSIMMSFNSFSQESCVILDYEPTVCNNEGIQFVLETKGSCTINNIVWIFNNTKNNVDSIMGAGPHSIIFDQPGLTTFSISYYDFELKTQVFKEKSFNVIEPVVGITIEPQNPCIGQLVKLKADGPKEGFFVWKGLSKQNDENLYEVVDSIKNDGQAYRLQWFLGSEGTSRGCSLKSFNDTIKIKKTTPLIIEPSNKINVCEGDVVNLKIKNIVNSNDYIWRSDDLVVSNTSLNIKPESTSNITVSTFENGCLRTENVEINVQQLPSFLIEPAVATICNGSSIELKILYDDFENEVDYLWTGGSITSLNTHNEIVEITPTASTTYTATWENSGCKVIATASIKTSENKTDIIGNKSINICNGETVKLTVNTPNKGVVKWFEKDFSNSIEAPTITVSPDKTTTYKIEWTDGICTDEGTITVNVNAKPNLNIVSAVGSRVCKGEPIDLQVFFTNGDFSNNFSWSLEEDQESLTTENSQLSFTATKSSNITVIWEDSGNICQNLVSENFYIDVLTKPEAITLEADKIILCRGDNVKFTVGGAILDNFILYNVENDEIVSDNFEGSSIKIIPEKTTNYVAWWLNDECLIVSDTIKVTVNEIPSITINNNEKICPNSNFEINVQPTNYSLYLWSGGDISENDLVTGSKLSRSINQTNLIYSLRISDNNNCTLDTLVTLDIVDLDIKAVSDKPANEVCEGEPIQLSVNGADSYLWDANEILTGDLSNNPLAFPTENFTELRVNAFKEGCSVEDIIQLYLKEKPNATVSENVSICYGDTIQLNGNGGQNYLWQPNLFLNNNEIENPVSTPQESIVYTLTVTAENACTDEATVTVNVQNDGCEIDLNKIFVPNTITPNDDGINDTWEIPAIADMPDYAVTIFTEFGVVVFNTTNYQNQFDGVNNNYLQEGTYYYIIQHLNSQNKKTGTLTIIR